MNEAKRAILLLAWIEKREETWNLQMNQTDKTELFAVMPVRRALFTLAVPTIISQMINLIYNMVDAFFIGRTGNPYMMAATTIALPVMLLNIAFANLFGIGGGSHIARLMGAGKKETARQVSAFSALSAVGVSLVYSLLIGAFLSPLLLFLGASEQTLSYTQSYTLIVVVIGNLPMLFSMVLGHLLRNTGYSAQASIGLSGGGILNVFLDPLFMFVLLPRGMEVTGAAIATTISNTAACIYLIMAYRRAAREMPLSMRPSDARAIDRENVKNIFAVGIPSAILTGLFDIANVCMNMLAAGHNDLVLAAIGICAKIERIPNAFNVGVCQGMLPIVAYNFASGNHKRMNDTIHTARRAGIIISVCCIATLELFAAPFSHAFLSLSSNDAAAMTTLGLAAGFLRIRCLASPVQFINYNSSYCMQAIGDGRGTMIHANVRMLVFYIPMMFVLDRLFGEFGLASALPVAESFSAVLALLLLRHGIRTMKRKRQNSPSL